MRYSEYFVQTAADDEKSKMCLQEFFCKYSQYKQIAKENANG